MKTIAAFLLAAITAASAETPAPPQTLMAQIDKLEFADSFPGTELAKEWKAAKGKWTVADGVLTGAEIPADKHGAVVRKTLQLQNMVVAYDVKLDGAKSTTLSINAPKEHLARISITPKSFTVRRDDQDHDGPDKAKVFLNKPVTIESGTWHTVVLEMVGDTMVGTLDGKITGQGSDPTFAAKAKANPGFTVAGESASIRNVRIYSAKAEPKADCKNAE